jgi:pyrroloquinoline quinone biosynthesis protein B
MQVRALGTAAGGGFPQWNCGCENCSAVRAGTFQGKTRTQAQLAVSPNGNTWFLLGASPDLRSQIEVTSSLHPRNGIRQSPIAGVVLASADLDHALGLLLLRELQPLRVYTTPAVRTILLRDNSMFRMLNRVPNQVAWSELPLNAPIHVRDASGSESGLRCEAVSLGSKYPAYVGEQRIAELPEGESLIGLIVSADSGKKLGYFPSVPQVSVELLARMDDLDLLFFDGTFWSDDELIRVQGSGQTARQMGHLPVGSSDGTLERLAGLRGPRKIFMHINNTNPMLNEAGPEYAKMREAGWELAEDGSEWRL